MYVAWSARRKRVVSISPNAGLLGSCWNVHLEKVVTVRTLEEAAAAQRCVPSPAAALLAQPEQEPFAPCFSRLLLSSFRKVNVMTSLTFVDNLLCETKWACEKWLPMKTDVKVTCAVSFAPHPLNTPRWEKGIWFKNTRCQTTQRLLRSSAQESRMGNGHFEGFCFTHLDTSG